MTANRDIPTMCITALAVLLITFAGGCGGGKDDGEAGTGRQSDESPQAAAVTPGSKERPTGPIGELLRLYRAGEKDRAIKTFLAIDWSDPPVGPDSLFALSEQELRTRSDSRELARKARDEVLVPLRGVVKAVLDEAQAAADRGDGAREKRCLKAVSDLADFMRSPERLESFRQFGKAVSQGTAGVQG